MFIRYTNTGADYFRIRIAIPRELFFIPRAVAAAGRGEMAISGVYHKLKIIKFWSQIRIKGAVVRRAICVSTYVFLITFPLAAAPWLRHFVFINPSFVRVAVLAHLSPRWWPPKHIFHPPVPSVLVILHMRTLPLCNLRACYCFLVKQIVQRIVRDCPEATLDRLPQFVNILGYILGNSARDHGP